MSEEHDDYVVFSRACRNWEEFARATKRVICKGLTRSKAREICAEYNDNRTPSQKSRGTKYEFCRAGYL